MYEMNKVTDQDKLDTLKRIQAAYPDLDNNLVPLVMVTGKGVNQKKFGGAYESFYLPQKGKVYFFKDGDFNCSEFATKNKFDSEKLERIGNRKGSMYLRGYAKFHPHPTDRNLDVLEMTDMSFPTDNFDRKAVVLDKKVWEKRGCGSVYIFRNDQFPYILHEGEWIKANVYEEGKYYNKALTKWMESTFGKLGCNHASMREITKFFYGTRDEKAFSNVRIYNGGYSVCAKYEQLSRTEKKRAELAPVLAHPLKSLSDIAQETCVIFNQRAYGNVECALATMTYYEKLPNNEGFVIREFLYDMGDLANKIADYNKDHYDKGIGKEVKLNYYWGTSFHVPDPNDPDSEFEKVYRKVDELKPAIDKEISRLYVLKKGRSYQCEHILSTMPGEEIDEFVPIKADTYSPFNVFNTEEMNKDGYMQCRYYKTK